MIRALGNRILTVLACFGLAGVIATPSPAAADGLFIEGGGGIIQSLSTSVVLLRYQKDGMPLFGHDGFYEGICAYWNGTNHAADVAIARGLRWKLKGDGYLSSALGVGYMNRETENLATHFEFYIRFALGRRTGRYDLSLGYIHISNGKLFLGWHGPDNGENFITLSIGGLF
jgi:hypothetical protein